jgi:3-phenylpropionate/trans-cinnamate dioxygenase ferredoxin subunit
VVPYYLEDRKTRILVTCAGGRLYAFNNLCAHEACPLSAGLLTGTTIMCQCHGSRFDITTAAIINGAATEPVNVHQMKEAEGEIQARI